MFKENLILCIKIVSYVNILCCWLQSCYTTERSGVPNLDKPLDTNNWPHCGGVGLTTNFPSNPFWDDDWYSPYINPASLIHLQSKNILHQANIDIYVKPSDPCTLEMIRAWGKMSKWEVVTFLFVLGAHVRVVTSINSCHFNANFAWTSINVYFG